mgnify:CR=1 FL=1
MFPVTITLNTADQLNAVMVALSGGAQMQVTPKADTEKKSEPKAAVATVAATEPAATPPTAAATAAPAPKAETSAPAIMDKDALTAAVKNAIAKVGRDPVVALMQSYGVGRAGEVPAEKRVTFDAALLALTA